MLTNYTPVSQLSQSELTELRQRAQTITESTQVVMLSSGKAILASEARQFAPSPANRVNLFG